MTESEYFVLFDDATSKNLALLKSIGENKFQLVFADKNFSFLDSGFVIEKDSISEESIVFDDSGDIFDSKSMSLAEASILYHNEFLVSYDSYGEYRLASALVVDDINNMYINFYKTCCDSMMGTSYEHHDSTMLEDLEDAIISLNGYHAKMIKNNK